MPADTYAGATQIMFVVMCLRQGTHDIKFHSFNCVPGPRIIAVEALAGVDRVRWAMYPGELIKVEIKPDFGWFGLLIAPFIERMYAWFDPRNRWNLYWRPIRPLLWRTAYSDGPDSRPVKTEGLTVSTCIAAGPERGERTTAVSLVGHKSKTRVNPSAHKSF